MAKRKAKSPAKPEPKRVKISLPVTPDCPAPEEVVVVPVVVAPAEVAPLAAPVTVRCVLALRETFWSGAVYVVLAAAPGHELPAELATGQQVDVCFSPPSQ